MTDDRTDLSSLHASGDTSHEDRVVRDVMSRIASTGATPARRPPGDVLDLVLRFARPVLAAAAAIALLSGTLLLRTPEATAGAEPEPTASQALGIPGSLARWAARPTEVPSTGEVVSALRGYR